LTDEVEASGNQDGRGEFTRVAECLRKIFMPSRVWRVGGQSCSEFGFPKSARAIDRAQKNALGKRSEEAKNASDILGGNGRKNQCRHLAAVLLLPCVS
jgi:hypothetical protein